MYKQKTTTLHTFVLTALRLMQYAALFLFCVFIIKLYYTRD